MRSLSALSVLLVATMLNLCEAIVIAPSPIVNANIKFWMTPAIIFGFLVFALVLLPLFYMIIYFTMYVQTPIVMPEKSIPWGHVEENEN
jgi:hypothetical protein